MGWGDGRPGTKNLLWQSDDLSSIPRMHITKTDIMGLVCIPELYRKMGNSNSIVWKLPSQPAWNNLKSKQERPASTRWKWKPYSKMTWLCLHLGTYTPPSETVVSLSLCLSLILSLTLPRFISLSFFLAYNKNKINKQISSPNLGLD